MTMIFEKVVINEPVVRQAVFRHEETGDFFLYSCVNHDMAHETMVFRCDQDGEVENHADIVSGAGYISSSVMMDRLETRLSHKCEMNEDMTKWHDMKRASELYKKNSDPYDKHTKKIMDKLYKKDVKDFMRYALEA